MQAVHSEYVSPCSPFVLKRWGHEIVQDLDGTHTSNYRRHACHRLPPAIRLASDPENLAAILQPSYENISRFPKLFGEFPKTLVVLGDAERLVHEVKSLVTAMKKDGVDVRLHVAPDAVHDILILNEQWWDKKVLQDTWAAIKEWGRAFGDVI